MLESDNYIERTVQELYQAVGIASAFGTILPQRRRDRRRSQKQSRVRCVQRDVPASAVRRDAAGFSDLRRGITNLYREVLYLFLQRFLYRGQMAFFGTTRIRLAARSRIAAKYVKALFDYISPILGDDLTNSEDIFIGFAMLNEGYRNIQLTDVYARTVEPEVQRLPRQIYLWSSSFLQSCYYFDPLMRSPFKAVKRWLNGSGGKTVPAPRARVPQTARAGAGSTSFLRASPASRVRTQHRHELSTCAPTDRRRRESMPRWRIRAPCMESRRGGQTRRSSSSSASRTARRSGASARSRMAGRPDGFC